MRVLITGAKGQLGCALCETAPVHAQVRAFGREHLDLTNSSLVRETIMEVAPDLLINAAAYTAVDKAESDVAQARAVNAEAVAELAGSMLHLGGRVVHISTDFVFDGMSKRPYRPSDRRNPLSVYGQTKAEGEDGAGDDALIVRTSWVYAAGHRNFVRTMLDLMRQRDELRVVADQIGVPTWADSLARTVWSLIKNEVQGIYHHCDAGVASWYDFAVAIKEEALALGMIERDVPIIPITTSDYPTPAARPLFSVLDCSATRDLLGDGHTHWRANLRRMLRQEKALG